MGRTWDAFVVREGQAFADLIGAETLARLREEPHATAATDDGIWSYNFEGFVPIQTSMEAAQIPWRPLGELLVEHGVLTRAELENALAEQQRSGRKLGEIIVEQGFASSPAVTRALAEQWGLELSPEGGFGTGLWGEIERRHREKRERESESDKPAREHLIIEFPGGLVRAADPPSGEAEDSEELLDEMQGRLEDSERRVEERTKQVTELEDVLAETRRELGRLRTRLAERDRDVAELAQAIRQPSEPETRAEAAAPAETAPAEALPTAHVLFVHGSKGYELVEREGPPPQLGEQVELEGGRVLVVANVSRSPLPGDRRPCVFLEAAQPPSE